jgi:hypothetical protein
MVKLKKAEILNILQKNGMIPDRFIQKKNGTFEFRRGFFYTHGNSADRYADKIKLIFPRAIIEETHDVWNPWPRDSYFQVIFKLPE